MRRKYEKVRIKKIIKEIIQESLDREIVVITNTGKQVFSERKVKEELMNKNYTSDNLYGWLYRDILSRGYLYTKETNKLNAKKLSINVIKQAIDDILQKVIDYNSSVVINVSKEKGKKPII